MSTLARKKRVTAITKGWANCNPILVVTAAEGHKTAKKKPAKMSWKFLLMTGFNYVFYYGKTFVGIQNEIINLIHSLQ